MNHLDFILTLAPNIALVVGVWTRFENRLTRVENRVKSLQSYLERRDDEAQYRSDP